MESNMKQQRLSKMLFLLAVVLSISVGALNVYNTWNKTTLQAKQEAISLAESAASFLSSDQLMSLNADPSDVNSTAYLEIKRDLSEFKKHHSEIRYAYLFKYKDGRLYFMADSESPESESCSPPGQEYYEATEQDLLPFYTGESVLTAPLTDRWGTWISALAPIKDPLTGKVIAMFGIDYPAAYWQSKIFKQVLLTAANIFFLILLLTVLYQFFLNNIKTHALSEKLRENETLFKAVFEQAPVGIAFANNYRFEQRINAEFARILSRPKEDFSSINWMEITHPDDVKRDLELFERFKTREIDNYTTEKRYIRPDGSYIWVNLLVSRINIDGTRSKSGDHLCIAQDINDKKIAEEALRESERSKSMLLSNLPGMAYRCKYDRQWTMTFISDGCYELTGYKPESLVNNHELSYNDIIAPEFRELLWLEWERAIKLKSTFRHEYEIITAAGEHKWVLETGQGVFKEDGDVAALEGIIIDITESKKRLDQIQYISEHDYMTGLYNRRYYESEKKRLDGSGLVPISIIMADINGIRLINDAFGHGEGDRLIIETAKIIQSCLRDGDTLCRTGGDDFTVILPCTGRDEAYEILILIKDTCEKFNNSLSNNEKHISLSVGFGTKESADSSLDRAEKEAEEFLRKRKLFEQKSYRNAVLSSIMATMYARSHETEAHSSRISKFCRMIGEKIGLSQKLMDDLHLFSMLHDLGKVGIDDRILNKPDKLNEEEITIMETHPEIGYKIAMSSPELESVADLILTHHERWDGSGYPYGKRGEEIPLLSRILAVADAYDAMTVDRVYRKALLKEAALEELQSNAGTQFDPEIVKIFVDLMRQSGQAD